MSLPTQILEKANTIISDLVPAKSAANQMADEADSGTEQYSTTTITSKSKSSKSKVKDDPDKDEKISSAIASSSNSLNFDSINDTGGGSSAGGGGSGSGGGGIGNKSSPIFRCERCDKFETHSHSLLLVHMIQCAAAAAAVVAASATLQTGSAIGQHLHLPNNLSIKIDRPSNDTGGSDSSNHKKNIINNNNNNIGHGDNDSMSVDNTLSSTTTIAVASSTASTNSIASATGASSATTETDPKQQQNANRKLFECDVCNMKFSNGANMRRHKMRHTGVKPYECRVCQKRFFRKDHLAEHFTTHTKTLPYHCPICNRGFQRQIAMRAHFQNEHVGQHDLVKTCPLCSYRAGTMKSLRVHFFNRHGIDLDNPGPGAPSSLLLALDPQNTGQYLPQNLTTATTCVPMPTQYSDSGDSLRSNDNATPPMHFLTPHVEISMAENVDSFNVDSRIPKTPSSLEIKCTNGPNGISPSSPQSIDSNSNVPSSSHTTLTSLVHQSSRNNQIESHITPSISLIPIKQEPSSNEEYSDKNHTSNSADHSTINNNSSESASPTNSLTSLIKVSPLKSLLREDLKRRICARANTRAARNLNNATAAAAASNFLASANFSSLAIAAAAAAAAAASSSSSQPATDSTTNTISNNANTTSTNGIITSTGGNGNIGQESSPELSSSPSLFAIAAGATGNSLINRLNFNSRKFLQCLFCGIEFPDQTLYFLHKGCHSDSNPWKCNICGEQCQNVYEFNSHLLSKSHQ